MSYSFAILATFTHKKNKGGQVVSKLEPIIQSDI
jgi:hypothetical protein